MTAVTVERRRHVDADEIFRLYADVFGETLSEGSRRRWRWQYQENPVASPEGPEIWVAREGERVLGQYASMPVRLLWGGREVRSSWGMDVFLRAEARGKGLGALLFTTWSDHVEVALGLGLTPSSYGLFQKLRYRDVGPVPFYRLVMDAGAVARRRLGPVLGALAAPAVRAALGPRAARAEDGLRVRAGTGFGPDHDALWESASPGFSMCVRRDAAYLDWKYVRGPHRHYQLWEVRGADEALRGFAVSRHEDYQGLRLGWLVDAFAGADDAAAWDAAVGAVLQDFAQAAVARAQAFAMGRPLQQALARRGFRRGGSPMQFCVRDRVGPEDVFADLGRWHVVFGDSDMDR